MKDTFASWCFAAALITAMLLAFAGLEFGSFYPFIPSSVVHYISIAWVPIVLALGFPLAMWFHRDARDLLKRRKLLEIYARLGAIKATAFMVAATLFFGALLWLAGDAGLEKSAVFLVGVLPEKPTVVQMHSSGLWGNKVSVKWVRVDTGYGSTSFSYPTSRLAFLPCTGNMVQISGSSSWAGIRVMQIQCGRASQASEAGQASSAHAVSLN